MAIEKDPESSNDRPKKASRPRLRPKNILVPLDMSPESIKALKYAVPFAEQFGAKLRTLFVVELSPLVSITGMDYVGLTISEQEIVKRVMTRLAAIVDLHHTEKLAIEAEVRTGKPVDEIVRYAAETDTDLIVLSTHGHSGMKRMMLGSVTEKVVRHAPCPVLVLRDKERDFV
ncbi:MAG: uspa protein [Verrucomicrobiales bacterium]|jgi:universal stress protein A|nr:uspa protein [Verrucomicrobiales bacterium]MDB6129628.1 uspa protein [Verrucomicrobiales bacterium]